MNEEVKEILKYLNKFINDKEEITKYGCEISTEEAKLLIDYITNLQDTLVDRDENIFALETTLKRTTHCYDEEEHQRLKNEVVYAKVEIDHLKEENKRIFSKINDDELLIDNANMFQELEDYKSRNEKAIEYVKHDLAKYINPSDLLNILQGSDNK